jgi:hypothetical protein
VLPEQPGGYGLPDGLIGVMAVQLSGAPAYAGAAPMASVKASAKIPCLKERPSRSASNEPGWISLPGSRHVNTAP